MKKYLSATKTIAVSALSVGLLAGCQKPAPQNPIADIVKQFEASRNQAAVQYGVKGINHKDQNIASVDCVVFNQAATSPMPIDSIGAMSAYLDSMRYRLQLGCATTDQTLPQYETARRTLQTTWQQTLDQSPHNIRTLLTNSSMGRFIVSQIKDVASEEKSCWGRIGHTKRQQGLQNSIATVTRVCAQKSASSNIKDQCINAWNVVTSHQYAQGARDDISYFAELVSRYRWMYNSCSATAPQEYVQFHSSVPPHLFQGPAYRFAVAVDPIMACQIRSINDKKARRSNYRPSQDYAACANDLDIKGLFTQEFMPNIITASELNNSSNWLFNPQRSNENPQLWSLNECEKNMINTLHARGINQVGPQSLKRYCVQAQRRLNTKQG